MRTSDIAPNTSHQRHIAIVGAGVSGLTAAYQLQKRGYRVTVLERSQHPGGRTMTVRKNGYAFDIGAITLLPSYEKTVALLNEIGCGHHLHRIRPIIGIPRNGEIHALDLAQPLRSLLTTQLLSTGTKLRALKLLPVMRKIWSLADFKSMSRLAPWDTESVADYTRRVLGDEFQEFVAGPIMRGNTLNSTSNAPAAELLWMLRQYAGASISGLDTGINGLAENLATKVPVQYGVQVTKVQASTTGVGVGVRVTADSGGGEFSQDFDACVVALAPPDLLALAPPMAAGQRRFLACIQPMPSVNVHLGLRHAPNRKETFILPPSAVSPDLTTIVLDHLKAPGRAPQGHGVVTMFFRPEWSLQQRDRADADVLTAALKLVSPFLGNLRFDIDTYVVQRWDYANVKSHVGLYTAMKEYERSLDPASPVQLAGDFLSQGIESAVISASTAAERISALLQPGSPTASTHVMETA